MKILTVLPHPIPLPLGEGVRQNVFRPFFAALVCLGPLSAALAQIPQNVSARQINLPVYEGTNISALFSGDAEPITGGRGELLLKDFEMKKFRRTTNEIEFFIKAAEAFCFFTPEEKRVWSARRLQVHDGQTNYFIEGEGFLSVLDKTNATLTISNRVHTLLQRAPTNRPAAIPPLKITSDHFYFVSETKTNSPQRTATYTGRVRVDDPEIGLTCAKLTLELPTGTNRVRQIEAEQDVVILSQADQSRAYGQRAVYLHEDGHDFVRLLGQPVWRDAQNEGRADSFLFDRTRRMVLANGHAHLKLPRAALASGGLFHGTTNAVTTNQFVEIASDHFGIQLSTNRTRSLLAQKNVVITSAADHMRATAEQAFFDEASGQLQLTGQAEWQTEQFTAQAEALQLDRTNQVFTAEGNARFYLLSQNEKSSAGATNQFVEIFCDRYEVKTNLAQFRGQVRAHFQQGNTPGELRCQALDVYLAQREVEQLTARGAVHFRQRTESRTNTVQKDITSEALTVRRSPVTQLTSSIVAETNVVMLETEKSAAEEKIRKLSADLVTTRFSSTTNQLESLVAERHVEIQQGENRAFGGKAVYRMNQGQETFELTENPRLVTRRGEGLMQSEGKTLIFDRATGKVRWVGLRSAAQLPVEPAPEKNVKSSLPK